MNPLIKPIAERAIKTFIQTLAAVSATANLFEGETLLELLGVSISAAIMSLITSVASTQFGGNGPSLAGEKVEPEEVAGH
jgi:Putative lactococcus lactis phage r1t holin